MAAPPFRCPASPCPKNTAGKCGLGGKRLREPRSPHQNRQEGRHQPCRLHQRLLYRHRQRNRRGQNAGRSRRRHAWPCPVIGKRAATALWNSPTPLSTPAKKKTEFKLLYDLDMPLAKRIELIAKEVYGADGVEYSADANAKAATYRKRSRTVQAGHLHGQNPSLPLRQPEH